MAVKHTINETTQALADKIAKGLTIDNKVGKATFADGLFNNSLPEGITPALVESLKIYETSFVAAGARAFSNAAVDAMAENKELKSVTGRLPMGHEDSADYTVDRTREIPKKEGGKELRYGILTTTLNVQAGNKHGEQFSAVKAMLAEHAAKLMAE